MARDHQQFWVKPAMVEEGSFCSRTSRLHYDNLSEQERRNASVAVSKCHKPESIATERVQDSSFEL